MKLPRLATAFPHRMTLQGPESDLVANAIESGLPFLSEGIPALLREPRMPTGFPDLLVAFSRQTEIENSTARREIGVLELKLLYHLSSIGTTTISDLLLRLAWDKKMIDVSLRKLGESKLIRRENGNVCLTNFRRSFILSKIIAIEAKIADWRRALEQAVANTWFASHSYILIPTSGIIHCVSHQAKNLGVGVLVFDGKSTKEVVKPSRVRIPSSYGSWLVNEWIVKNLMLNRRYARRKRASVCLS